MEESIIYGKIMKMELKELPNILAKTLRNCVSAASSRIKAFFLLDTKTQPVKSKQCRSLLIQLMKLCPGARIYFGMQHGQRYILIGNWVFSF